MYKLLNRHTGETYAVKKQNEDGSITCFVLGSDTNEHREYLKWLEEGNTPLPADE